MVKIEENGKGYDPNILPDLLPVYYKRLFPHKPFYRWLSYGNCEYFRVLLFDIVERLKIYN